MSVAEEIKARLDLVAYISETVSLKKAGRTFKARCPFHQERTPSFVVFPETQTWRCFGACGDGGDIFAFAMKQHGWDFKEALTNLAERAGVEIKARTPEEDAHEAAFERLLGLLDETARYFNHLLKEAPEAEAARAYVERRGLNAQTVETFLLGYAPDGWQGAINHLTDLGYAVADLIEAGVAIRNDQGRVYDRFRHRLMIPIRDGRGRVIGFGARALRDEDHPKYLNSPQTELFDKSKTLFGLDLARREIRETETAVIVEGYMDVMQAHQAGFSNVVAQMGTALTDPQLQALRRYADRLILALDPDQAGASATMRGLNVARESLNESDTAVFGRDGSMRAASRLGIDMRVIVLPDGFDPDDLIREQPDEWRRLMRDAEPVADYAIRVATAGLDMARATIFEKEKVARALLPLLTATESDLHREANVQKLALRLHLSEKRLMEIAKESRQAIAPRRTTDPRLRQRGRTSRMDEAARQWKAPEPPPPQAARPAPRDDWQEGPPPAYDEDMAPPDEEGEAIPDLLVAPRGTYRPRPIQPEEYYCLGALLRHPELLYHTNRALREIIDSAKKYFSDAKRQEYFEQMLVPLEARDFSNVDYGVILQALQASLSQDDTEPSQFVKDAVGESLRWQIDALIEESLPSTLLQDRLKGQKRVELQSTQKQMRREGRFVREPESEVVDKVFSLRMARLKREKEELYFMLQELESNERVRYQDMLDATNAAILFLDRVLRQRAQLAQE